MGLANDEGRRMRFDTARAMEWAATFAFPREAGTAGEGRAAAIAAAEFSRIGFRVERVAVDGSRLPAMALPWLGWVGLGAWATALVLAANRGAAWPIRLAPAVGALLWLRLTTVEGFRLGRVWPRRIATTNVVAWREVEPTVPLRVVFHTALDTFQADRAIVPAWLETPWIALLLAGQIFVALTVRRNPLGLPAWTGPLLLSVLWLAIAGRVLRLIHRPGWREAETRDNRTGLAVLLEMARGWPRGTDARFESRFVATGGRALDRAGLRALVRAIAEDSPARPTLIVEWLAPGIGPGIALMEQGTGELAAKAAADLWIPHHVIHQSGVHREHWPFGRHGPGYVGIVGNAIDRPHPIDPDSLARAAQLATEIALRWARQKKD
jgi:hypothetical protein